MTRLRLRDLNLETQQKLLGEDVEWLTQRALEVLGRLAKHPKAARWAILHRALQVDGGEPLPASLAKKLARWLGRELKKGWSLKWTCGT